MPAQNRREFLKSGSAAAAVTFAWSGAAKARSVSANEKLSIACIGTANRALANIQGVAGEDIVALCDVDSVFMERTVKGGKNTPGFPDARQYRDYREMIEQEADKVDAVVVATADHNHAPATIRALRKNKHVYCEKPLTHTVQEARIVAETAKARGLVTQMGTQIHAGDNYRRVVEIIQSGAIGDVTEVHVWVGKVWGGGELPKTGQEPPSHLDWDLWLGPAPERPYYPGRYHPAQWRKWWDFGGGTLADMACHFMDLPFWALKLRHPTTCEAEGPPVHPQTCPMGLTVRYQYPERDGLAPCTVTWSDGNMIPRKVNGQRVGSSGVMFVGDGGMMFADYGSYRLFPQDKFAGFKPPKQTIPKSIGHHAEWIKACKEGDPSQTTCNFDYSGALTEAVLLGAVAYRTGQKLEWDAKNLTATNCPEAASLITKKYRPGWEVVMEKEAASA